MRGAASARNNRIELTVGGTPIDLRRVVAIDKPAVRVTYELEEITKPDLGEILDGFLKRRTAK